MSRNTRSFFSILFPLMAPVFSAGAKAQYYRLPSSSANPSYGILLLGQGGNPGLYAVLQKALNGSQNAVPLEVAMGYADRLSLETAVQNLESEYVDRIVVVSLGIGPDADSVLAAAKYELGAATTAPRNAPSLSGLSDYSYLPSPLAPGVPVVFSKPFGESKVLVKVLAARARALTPRPAKETLVLVESANRAGASPQLEKLAQAVGKEAGFKRSAAFAIESNLRSIDDDSVRGLRSFIEDLRAKSKTTVVPVAIAYGPLCDAIAQAIAGLDVKYDGTAIMPDPQVTAWIGKAAKDALSPPSRPARKTRMLQFAIPSGQTPP